MSTGPTKKSPHRPRSLDGPYDPGDTIPAGEVSESGTESAWAQWSDEVAKQDVIFADTLPASIPAPLPQGDRRYAQTVPSALTRDGPAAGGTGKPATPGVRKATVPEAMTESRRNNRVCPKPDDWVRLYNMLPAKQQGAQGWQPPPPLTGGAWSGTPSLAKRMCLRDHIEWAAAHGGLDAVLQFMKDLPEERWHHMGD